MPVLPREPADVDAAWLSAVLREPLGGARVVALEPAEAAGGIAVTSRVLRFLLQVEPDDAPGPRSVIVKLPNPAWTRGTELYRRELRFYRELAAGLPVPRCYHAAIDEAGAFVLVLEDLSDADPGHRLAGFSRSEAEAVIDALAALHGAWWKSERLADWPGKTYSPERAERFQALFQERWPQLRALGRFPIGPELEAAVERLFPSFPAALLRLSRGPRTLIHSDLHAENLLLDTRPDGSLRPVIIDWQNAACAHPAFDLVNVLGCVAPAELPGALDPLVARYHAGLGPARAAYPPADLARDLLAAVRWLFAGVAGWLVVFEAESLRDLDTVQGHWARLAALLPLSRRWAD